MVFLDPATHTYLDADNNQYLSVTRLINLYSPQFDFDNKSKQYASKYGMDVEEVRKQWKDKNKQSTDFGSLIHEQIEHKLKHKKHKKSSDFESVVARVCELVEESFEGEYLLEHPVWDKSFKVAGTSDLIIDNINSFSVVDFKTNKQIKYTNDYSEKFLLKPVEHLPNSEYFKYSLQLSLYALLYSKLTDKSVDRLCFYWLKRKNNSYEKLEDSRWVRFNVPFLKEEAEALLNEYRKAS